MSITGTTRLSKGFYLYMPADAQDTHIMKAHLRKHKVFHNIVSALENVAFNNSLGNRNHRSQHLVETPFQRFERTGTRKNKREYPQHRLEISIPAPSGSASSSLGKPHAKQSQSTFGTEGKLYAKNAHQVPRQRHIQMTEGRKWKTGGEQRNEIQRKQASSRLMSSKRRKCAPKPATNGRKKKLLPSSRFQ